MSTVFTVNRQTGLMRRRKVPNQVEAYQVASYEIPKRVKNFCKPPTRLESCNEKVSDFELSELE